MSRYGTPGQRACTAAWRGEDTALSRFVEEIEARSPDAEEAEFLNLTEAQQVLEVTP
ncbi:hypothetical protein [Thermocatellispora tengchongensis]|uniref:hypothetical protein n=1 Tax=Thermocatellispora tengchongensis TaxID=1073253 RepID=UPI00362A2638